VTLRWSLKERNDRVLILYGTIQAPGQLIVQLTSPFWNVESGGGNDNYALLVTITLLLFLLARLKDNTIQNPDFHHLRLYKPRSDCSLSPHQLRQWF
ncbi:MAG TPA: hypothetical protein VE971_05440, partial [Candidatus Eisenbacteria bacterium]|nr:hypothetical protein [Candidatus Eisenbacteria bacterium]